MTSRTTRIKKQLDEDTTQLIITNQRVINFYKNNKQLNFEKINEKYVDLFENIMVGSIDGSSIVSQLTDTINNQNTDLTKILFEIHNSSDQHKNEINNQKKDLDNILSVLRTTSEQYKNELDTVKSLYSLTSDTIKSEINNIKLTITGLNSALSTKIHETKDNYIKELKDLIKTGDNESLISLGKTIETHSNTMLDKIHLILNDVIPSSQSKYYDETIKEFKNDIMCSLEKNDSNMTVNKLTEIIENKYNNLISNIHENILNYISLSENRLTTNIEQIKEHSQKQLVIQDKLNNELSTYINRHKTSSSKGHDGQNMLFKLIETEYPSCDLQNTSGHTGMGCY
jgi:hypothetical protein